MGAPGALKLARRFARWLMIRRQKNIDLVVFDGNSIAVPILIGAASRLRSGTGADWRQQMIAELKAYYRSASGALKSDTAKIAVFDNPDRCARGRGQGRMPRQ